jgi:hypothetical protein
MTVATQSPTPADVRRRATVAARRFGYVLAAAINLAMLYVATHLLEWQWPPWLTARFDDVLPLLSVSLIVTAAFNVAWIAYDARWFKSTGTIVQSIISGAVTVRMLQVFPFDFSAYDFNWESVARAVLILALVGVSIGLVAESVKLIASQRH